MCEYLCRCGGCDMAQWLEGRGSGVVREESVPGWRTLCGIPPLQYSRIASPAEIFLIKTQCQLSEEIIGLDREKGTAGVHSSVSETTQRRSWIMRLFPPIL